VAKICLSLTAKTIRRDLEILEKYRKYADIAELRVDCLEPDERFLVRRFPEQARIPVILTIRRSEDGGQFVGGEGARVNLMARGLAFAEADRRLNFAYLDVEDDLNVPSLEEAARTFGTRIIRSRHNIKGTDTDLPAIIRSMNRSGEEIVKLAVTVNSTADVLNLFRAGKECAGQEKILVGLGYYGTYSRILAEKFGSYLSYSGAYSEPDILPAAPGQVDVRELAELYRFRSITSATGVYGVVGFPVKVTGGPFFFNTVFRHEEIDAVYAPFPSDSIESFMNFADDLNIAGLSVTVPFKEEVIPFLEDQSLQVRNIGACNTLIRRPNGWFGTNTGIQAFSDSLLHFTGRTGLKRQKVTLIGAGGMAKAAASELHRLGAKVLILNRTLHKARDLSSRYKFAWGGLGTRGVEMMDRYRDIIIQATSVGMTGAGDELVDTLFPADVLEMYRFNGREKVMDLVYDPEMTPFLKRAVRAGCMVVNGYDMLTRQARYQYTIFTGRDFPEYLLRRVRFGGN
jgi:3-dehydroquinate dehydratase/shikimate dehydrogenase